MSFQRGAGDMIKPLVEVIRHSPLLWMLVFVPVVLVVETIAPTAHTLLFVLAVLFGVCVPNDGEQGNRSILAEGVGFEPTVPLQARRFSRPVP
jgi:hypothetical protein